MVRSENAKAVRRLGCHHLRQQELPRHDHTRSRLEQMAALCGQAIRRFREELNMYWIGPISIVVLAAIAFLYSLDMKRQSRNQNGNFLNSISGSSNLGILMFMVLSQMTQITFLQNQAKVIESNVLKISPYIALSFKFEKFEFYKSYKEMTTKNPLLPKGESEENSIFYSKIKGNEDSEIYKKLIDNKKEKPLNYYGIENGVQHIKTFIYNEGTPIYNATIAYKPYNNRPIETKYIRKIGKYPIEIEIIVPAFYFISGEDNKAELIITGTDINANIIRKTVSIFLRDKIKEDLKEMNSRLPKSILGNIVYARRATEYLTYKIDDLKMASNNAH